MTPHSYKSKQNIGIVPQQVAVINEMSVTQNIDYFCGLYIRDRVKRKEYVEEAISFVGLNDFRKFTPKKLSGGLLRRLNIACGIVHKPKLIIMDEPTVAVDPQSRNNILEGILKLNKQGATIIYTSHYMEEVEQICSRIVIMDKGKNLAMGTKEDLKTMIKTGETIRIEIPEIELPHLKKIEQLEHVFQVTYQENYLTVKCAGGHHNVVYILRYLQEQNISFGRVFSELPTLNDVFLEITGTQLRD
jgi:ABC-2 type transport system ATP-binding protein